MGQRLEEPPGPVDFLIDTTFLIRLWRERKRSTEHRFVVQHPEESVCMSWVVKGEFLRGAVVAGHDAEDVHAFLDRYPTVWATDETLRQYAQVYKGLIASRQMIGANDLWIAASAIEHDLPLLTRNIGEFQRVPELRIVDYAHDGEVL